jgi:hypothetical protein
MTSRGRVGPLRDRVRSGPASAAMVNLDVERSLVVVDDAARQEAVAAEVAVLVDAGEMVCRVVAADENVLQAIRQSLIGEQFDVVVLALSSCPDPRWSRDVARAVGVPVVWVPVSGRCRAGPPNDGHPRWGYACSTSGTDVERER